MGKVGVLLNVECEEEKGRRGRRPVRKYYTKKEATNGRPTRSEERRVGKECRL